MLTVDYSLALLFLSLAVSILVMIRGLSHTGKFVDVTFTLQNIAVILLLIFWSSLIHAAAASWARLLLLALLLALLLELQKGHAALGLGACLQ